MGGIDDEPSDGLGADELDDELEPKDGVDGRGGDGGAAGRGGDIVGAAGFGAIGAGDGRDIGADDIGVMLGAFALGAALRADFLRAAFFAFFAVLRFAAGRPRRFAAARLPFFARLLAAAERRLVFARAPFLRPRFDFDFERAIKPPVSGMKFATSSVALRRPVRMREENEFVKPIPVRIIGHLLH